MSSEFVFARSKFRSIVTPRSSDMRHLGLTVLPFLHRVYFAIAGLLLFFGLSVDAGVARADIITFRQGVDNGFGVYAGAVDTTIATAGGDQANQGPDVDNSTLNFLRVDLNQAQDQSLLRFDDIFGTGLGQIPLGATINSATLRLVTGGTPHAPGNAADFHRMLVSWQDTDTWNTLVNGVQKDDIEARSAADVTDLGSLGLGPVDVNVTTSLQAWSDGETNLGWLLAPTGTNRWAAFSSEDSVSNRPQLTVDFTEASTQPIPEPSSLVLLGMGAIGIISFRRIKRKQAA